MRSLRAWLPGAVLKRETPQSLLSRMKLLMLW